MLLVLLSVMLIETTPRGDRSSVETTRRGYQSCRPKQPLVAIICRNNRDRPVPDQQHAALVPQHIFPVPYFTEYTVHTVHTVHDRDRVRT